jgi:putative transposase
MLDFLARQGARKMLTEALDEEVTLFLERRRYERAEGEAKGYRNGMRERKLTVLGAGLSIPVQKVEGTVFHSSLLKPYQRRSTGVDELFRRLYVEGLSSRDFEPALQALLGDQTTLSSSTILRLAQEFQQDLAAFMRRDLRTCRYAYVWADGVYLKAGLEKENTALLVLVGVNAKGIKELIAVMEGYRESRESWREIWRDVSERGMPAPKLVIGDGIAGLWDAVAEVYPEALDQRCWKHKMRNVLDKVPRAKEEEVLAWLRRAYEADKRGDAEITLKELASHLEDRYPKAAECVRKDHEALLRYFDFPKAHWVHLKTTNPIESIFAGVRLRTRVVRRFQRSKTGVAFVFKVLERLAYFWSPIEEPEALAVLWADQEVRESRRRKIRAPRKAQVKALLAEAVRKVARKQSHRAKKARVLAISGR